jgi:hypothetical protein
MRTVVITGPVADLSNLNQAVVAAIQTILNEGNGGNRHEIADAILEAVRCDHRTLQQNFWSVILQAQIKYADQGFDGRNAAAVEFAKAVKELAIKMNMDMGFPYI